MLDWIREHQQAVYLIAGSLGLGLIGLIAGAIVVVRMPADALVKEPRAGGRPALRILRNVVGWLLILAGLAMLVLPGPGVVVLLLGIVMAEFPGKRRVQRWILSRGAVLAPINRLRKRFGREPLKVKKGRK